MESKRSVVCVLTLLTIAFLAGCKSGPERIAFRQLGKTEYADRTSHRSSESGAGSSDMITHSATSVDQQTDAIAPELRPVSFDLDEPVDDQTSETGGKESASDGTARTDDSEDDQSRESGRDEGGAQFAGFTGESLEQAWSVALTVDQSLQASRWGTSAAQRGLFAAKSEYLPSMSVGSTYNAMDRQLALKNPLPIPGLSGIAFSNREFVTAGVTVTQPIFTSGKITNAIEAAGAAVTASQTDEVTTALDIKLAVAETYINVLRAQRAVEIAETARESLREHERVVGRLVEEGVVVRNDLLAVRVRAAGTEQALLATQNTLNVARAAYNRALGRPLASPVGLQEIADQHYPGDVDGLTMSAISRRPETAKLSAIARSLRSQADAVKSGNLPQFFVVGGYNFGENRYFVNEAFTTVSIVGDWNFFDSGRNKHKSEQLMQSAEGLIRTRMDVETKIALQVRAAWLALQTALKQVEVNRTAIESADENLRVSRNRYEQGTVTNTVVLDAVTLRTGAYNLYYNSTYDVAIASMRLRRSAADL